MNLIRINSAERGQLPFTKNTLYKFSSQKRFPGLIYLVGGVLVFDMEEWSRMAKKAKAESVKKGVKLRSVKG